MVPKYNENLQHESSIKWQKKLNAFYSVTDLEFVKENVPIIFQRKEK